MENASKALIMAGSVLIALMIIGALLLMFNNLSSYQDTNIQNNREAQVLEFNNQYETYNRKEIRGSDLYSLLNKVVDYNRRKSDVATGNDEGQNTRFEPMTIIVNFPDADMRKLKWTYDNNLRLFNASLIPNNKLELNNTSNSFVNNVENKIEKLEKAYGGKVGITNLASGISNLFFDDLNVITDDQKTKAISLYKRNTGEDLSDQDMKITSNNTKYGDICTYYEYIQFKRSYFDCKDSGIEYSKNTGRIIKMEFDYNQDKIE